MIFLAQPDFQKIYKTLATVTVAQLVESNTSGQSYKGSTIVNYDSRVVADLKIPHITTLES